MADTTKLVDIRAQALAQLLPYLRPKAPRLEVETILQNLIAKAALYGWEKHEDHVREAGE